MLKNQLFKNNKPGFGLAGRYRFVVGNAETGRIRLETDWSENMILDAGLNRLGVGAVYGHCHIGTGTTAPATGDTTLAALSATTNNLQSNTVSNSGAPSYISSRTVVYRFTAGTLNGNYTEVGIGWTNALLFSRALILDGGGSPTSITVGSSEYLDVYYELRVVPDLTDYSSSVTISGTSYTITRRPSEVSNTNRWNVDMSQSWKWGYTPQSHFAYAGTLGAVTGGPSGASAVISISAVTDSYVNNSFELAGTLSIGLNSANLSGGVKSFYIQNVSCVYQYEFSPNVAKDSTKTMTLTGKLTWARI